MKEDGEVRHTGTRVQTLLGNALAKAGKRAPISAAVRFMKEVAATLSGDRPPREELEAALAQQRDTAQRLAESEARFREVFLRAPNPLAIVRVSDAYIYDVNDAFVQRSGYTREQILNGGASELPWWPENEGVRIKTLLRQRGQLRDEEVRVIDANGEVHGGSHASPSWVRSTRSRQRNACPRAHFGRQSALSGGSSRCDDARS